MTKTRIGGYSASELLPPPHPVHYTESTSQSGHLCVEGRFIFWFAVLFRRWRGRWGLRVPWAFLLVEGIGAFAPLLLFGGGQEKWYFSIFTILIAMGCVVWLFVLTGTGVSVSCGQVNLVCIAIEIVDFWLRCVVSVVEPGTKEAAVRLKDVFVDCSEMAAFLASGNEIPRSNSSFCTFFSSFYFGHSWEDAACLPLQLMHSSWWLQLASSWPASPNFTHAAEFLHARELWSYFWQLKQRRGFGI